MLFDPDLKIEKQPEVIKSKQNEIVLLTKELRSRYYKDKHFMDSDKTFIILFDKIIAFFDRDDLCGKIQEDQFLYQKYKDKYENALQLLETQSEEKNKLIKILLYAKNKPDWLLNQINKASGNDKDSDYTTLLKDIDNDIDNSSNDDHCNAFNDINKPNSHLIPIEQKETLKEDHDSLKELISQYNSLKGEYDKLKEYTISQNNTLTQLDESNKIMQSQIYHITKDRDDTYHAVNIFKEKLAISEHDVISLKVKNNHFLSKFKFLENELVKANKKNQGLNSNVRELSEELHQGYENQQLIQLNYEEIIEGLENRMIVIENEKKRVDSDSVTALIRSTAKKSNDLSLVYNSHSDNIQIKYDNEAIGEISNNYQKNQDNKDKDNPVEFEHKMRFDIIKEKTICEFKPTPSSNSNQLLSPNKNYSLKQLSSNKRSVECKSVLDDDKENNKNSLNKNKTILNSIGYRQQVNNSNIIIDKNKKKKNNYNTTTTTCFNNGNNLANCILKANINKEGLTFANENKKESKKFGVLSISSHDPMSIMNEYASKQKEESVIENNFNEYIGKQMCHIDIKAKSNLIDDKKNEQSNNNLGECEKQEIKSFNNYSDDIYYYSENMIVDKPIKHKDGNEEKIEIIHGKCNGCILF